MAHTPHDHDHSHAPPSGALGPAVDPAQESLVHALRTSFNVLRLLMVVLVIGYLFSGLFRVEPGQQGLVARLGKLRVDPASGSHVFKEGWHPALPDPFDEKYALTGEDQTLKVTTFMFDHTDAASAKDLAEIVVPKADLTPGRDGAMLTGDRNLSHGRWEVQYRIEDAALFVQNVGDSAQAVTPLLQRLTESAVVREVAGRTVEEVTRTALDGVREGVRVRIQRALDELQTGVRIVQVVAYTIEPGAVRGQFLAVLAAENEQRKNEEEAKTEAARVLSEAAGDQYDDILATLDAYGQAQLLGAGDDELAKHLADIDRRLDEAKLKGAGMVAVRLSAAEARADEINETVRREFDQFTQLLAQRAVQPGATELDLWVQMRRKILGARLNEIFFAPRSNEIEILITSDPQRKIELEEERALERMGLGPR